MNHEPGCYGDGALGHQHTREQCAAVLRSVKLDRFVNKGLPVPHCNGQSYWGVNEPYTPPERPDDLIFAMSDDGGEEIAACEWLNKHAPHPHASWGWQDGDFGLWLYEAE